MCAHQFFGLVHNPVVAAAIGKPEPPPVDSDIGLPTTVPFEPWSVADFSRYLSTLGLPAAGDAVTLHRILSSMERAGLLLPLGWDPRLPVMGQKYISQGAISKGQRGGNLWLSEVFGAELIIPSYNAVTVQLAGHDDAGNPVDSWGTGLVVDHNHVITNKHVVTGLAGTSAGLSVYPSSNHAEAELVNFSGTAHPHPTLDVAVIKFEMPEGKYIPRLGGMAFRDPDWADEVYVFGYPRVPMTAEMAITVQRGEVVNPAATTIPGPAEDFPLLGNRAAGQQRRSDRCARRPCDRPRGRGLCGSTVDGHRTERGTLLSRHPVERSDPSTRRTRLRRHRGDGHPPIGTTRDVSTRTKPFNPVVVGQFDFRRTRRGVGSLCLGRAWCG